MRSEELLAERERVTQEIVGLKKIWHAIFGAKVSWIPTSLRYFLSKLTVDQVYDAMTITERKFDSDHPNSDPWLLFCAICHRKIDGYGLQPIGKGFSAEMERIRQADARRGYKDSKGSKKIALRKFI